MSNSSDRCKQQMESGSRALLSPKVGRGPRAEFPPAKETWQGLIFVFREENRVDLYHFSAPPVLLTESESVRRTAVLSSENRPGWNQNKGSCTTCGDSTLHWAKLFHILRFLQNSLCAKQAGKILFSTSQKQKVKELLPGLLPWSPILFPQ